MLRRSLLASFVMVATAGAAQVLKPRPDTGPAPFGKLDDIVPKQFAGWQLDPYAGGGLVVNPSLEKVLNTLYSDQLSRTYVNASGQRVMLSLAYGRHQSRDLQVHKPEVCYVAQGFQLQAAAKVAVNTPLGSFPAMRLVARLGQRNEPVTYWIRIGDKVIRGWWEQNQARVAYGLQGRVPDGLLVRASTIDNDAAHGFELQERFLADMVAAVAPANRPMFVGAAGTAPAG
jgi:EpsI family protein